LVSTAYDRRLTRCWFARGCGQADHRNPSGERHRGHRQAEPDATLPQARDAGDRHAIRGQRPPGRTTPTESAVGIASYAKECLEAGCGIALAALPGPPQRAFGIDELSASRQDHPETSRRGGMAARVGQLIRTFCASQVTSLFEHRTQVEGGVGVAALAGARVALLGGTFLAACFEEHPQVEARGGMAERVGIAVRLFGQRQLARLLELQPEGESLGGINTAPKRVSPISHPPRASKHLT
jgi:hypothetical protein